MPDHVHWLTNGFDADIAWPMFTPEVEAGVAVTWTYRVTNTLDVDMTGVVISDDDLGEICTVDVAAGDSALCETTGDAVEGLYSNLGTAAVTVTVDTTSTSYVATDPSHYLGFVVDLDP